MNEKLFNYFKKYGKKKSLNNEKFYASYHCHHSQELSHLPLNPLLVDGTFYVILFLHFKWNLLCLMVLSLMTLALYILLIYKHFFHLITDGDSEKTKCIDRPTTALPSC